MKLFALFILLKTQSFGIQKIFGKPCRLTRLINPLGLQEFIMHSINPVKPLSNHTSYSPYRVILESLTSRYVLMIDEGVNIYEVFR